MNKLNFVLFFGIWIFVLSCQNNNKPLPILGETTEINGEEVPHTIPDFSFISQDSQKVTNTSLQDYIHVADFFFTSCPSICPIVTKQMLRIYEEFEQNEQVKLVSFTMDPKRDTPKKLNQYASNLEVTSDKWLFLTGDKRSLHNLANDYFNVVIEDDEAPGGFNHTGKIILVDKDLHIRSFCEGTDPDDVTKFMKDIHKLLQEYEE